jgi:hypothetical protein
MNLQKAEMEIEQANNQSVYSDYIVYVDESGDHSLQSINGDYPYFVLAFCIFKKSDYIERAVPELQQFKFAVFGHDMVVLHEHEIRKSKAPFNILMDKAVREPFFIGLNNLMENLSYTIVASVIDKTKYLKKYGSHAHNPYELSLLFCMERLQHLLTAYGQANKLTHIVLECRGKKEDNELELAFRRFTDQHNFRFEPIFAHKQNNSAGLQFADLVARPIGRHVMKPEQNNRSFDILNKKLYRVLGDYREWGLKVFP